MAESSMLTVVSTTQLSQTWFLEGACRNSDLGPDAWFPSARNEKSIPRAKAICMGCPVRARCLAESLRFDDSKGIWAGLDELDRRRIIMEMT